MRIRAEASQAIVEIASAHFLRTSQNLSYQTRGIGVRALGHIAREGVSRQGEALCSMLTTNGYAVLAAALIQPVLTAGATMGLFQFVGFVAGLLIEGVALYVAPYGKVP